MSNNIEMFKAKDFIRQKSDGGLDLDASLDVVRTLASAAAMTPGKNIMIDARTAAPTALGYGDMLKVVAEFVAILGDPTRKIALLPSEKWDSADSAKFVRAALDTKGHPVEIFATFEEALRWLSE